jgi:hypothetical protein
MYMSIKIEKTPPSASRKCKTASGMRDFLICANFLSTIKVIALIRLTIPK